MVVPVMGPVSMINTQTVAPGFFRSEQKIEAKRFYSKWLMNGESGVLMIDGTETIIEYDKDDKNYWFKSPEDYFNNPDTSSDKTYSFNMSFSGNDIDAFPPKITRTGGNDIEYLYGFRTKKWITTISSTSKRIVLEEWYVDNFPLITLSDSLQLAIKSKFHPENKIENFDHGILSSNTILEQLDTLNTFNPIPGFAVKINFLLYEGNDRPKSTLGYEIVELYAEPVDSSFFTIPIAYERIEKK